MDLCGSLWILEIHPVNVTVVNNVVNSLLIMTASCSVFDVPFGQQMPTSSMQSSDAFDGGPLASRKVKSGTAFLVMMSVNPDSLLHLSFSVVLVSRREAALVQKGYREVRHYGDSSLRSFYAWLCFTFLYSLKVGNSIYVMERSSEHLTLDSW